MALELVVPSVGESVSEVEIGAWLKQPGDPVRKDEAVVVIETDKATMEIFAPADGTLGEARKRKGEKVKAGDVVGTIEAGAAPVAPKPESPAPASTPPAASPAKAAGKAAGEARVMPAAARAAVQAGLMAAEVPGTGPGGRVLKEDVERAAAAKSSPPTAAETP
jgi:2-oxoglutarate dehydrogenase E2 component (dihydrolipoamide succinyltransferase)